MSTVFCARFLAVVLTVAGHIATCNWVASAQGNGPSSANNQSQGGQIIEGRYIVRLADNINAAKVSSAAIKTASNIQMMKQQLLAAGAIATTNSLASTEVKTTQVFTDCINGFVVTGVPNELYQSLLQTPGFIAVEQDKTVSIYDTLLDDHILGASYENGTRSLQAVSQVTPWGIKRVNGPIKPNPNPNGKIFIIDTGISQVSDLNLDTSLSIDFSGGGSWKDGNGHGTHVAGTVAAIDNSINVVGVVPGASVVAVRVLYSSGSGYYSNVIAGVNYVASKGKPGDVANMSLGGGISGILNSAVSNAAAKGIMFAVAAGNFKEDANNYSPASASGANVYAVSCHDSFDKFCSFSNFGSVVRYSGPGLSVLSLTPNGGTTTLSGTSMSCPHIAGLLFAGNIKGGGFVKGDPDGVPDTIAVYAGVQASNPVLPPAVKPTPVVPPIASPSKRKVSTAKPNKKGKLD
jgi:hypothetical protein